jgi:hypothetical protein
MLILAKGIHLATNGADKAVVYFKRGNIRGMVLAL